jgi:hypothetical protein
MTTATPTAISTATPAGGFYVTGGAMGLDAPSYIPRRADEAVHDALARGEFCYVLTPSQMGKSSLMARAAARLAAEGAALGRVDLTGIGDNVSAESWYYTLLLKIGNDLGLKDELRAFWQAHGALGPLRRWTEAVREVVLARRTGRVVVFIDEIGVVAKLPFSADEFFAAVRELYHRRESEPVWGRLTFCLLGVATPSELLRDPRTTAINFGRRIDLNDFTPAEARPLARGFVGRDAPTAARLLERVLYWTGGQPYLTQRLCRAVADEPDVRDAAGVDRVCHRLYFRYDARTQEVNLKEVERQALSRVPDRAGILDLYRRVRRRWPVRTRDDERDQCATALRISGLVRSTDGYLAIRNRIYRGVFDPAWIAAHMPDAELRRQNAAFRRGFALAALVTFLVVGTLVYGVSASLQLDHINMLRQQAEKHSKDAAISEAAAQRESVRLKAVILEVRNALQNIIHSIPDEASRDPQLRFVPRPFQNKLLEMILLKSLQHYKQMASAYPDVALIRSGLAATHHELGKVRTAAGKPREAVDSLRKAVDNQVEAYRLGAKDDQESAGFCRDLELYSRDLAAALRAVGRLSEAAEVADARAGWWPDDPQAHASVADDLAACAARADAGAGGAYAARAVAALRRAVALGYNDLRALENDPGLDPLRARDDFRSLLAAVGSPGEGTGPSGPDGLRSPHVGSRTQP